MVLTLSHASNCPWNECIILGWNIKISHLESISLSLSLSLSLSQTHSRKRHVNSTAMDSDSCPLLGNSSTQISWGVRAMVRGRRADPGRRTASSSGLGMWKRRGRLHSNPGEPALLSPQHREGSCFLRLQQLLPEVQEHGRILLLPGRRHDHRARSQS